MVKKEVAVGNGIALVCKMVDDKEYAQLMSENAKALDLKDKQESELKKQLDETNKAIAELKREIKVLKGEE